MADCTFVICSDAVVAPLTQLVAQPPALFERVLKVEPPFVETNHWNEVPLAIVGESVKVALGQTVLELMSVVTLGAALTVTVVLLLVEHDPSVFVTVRVT